MSEESPQKSKKQPIATHSFALAVVERNGKFLLVQERKPGNPWYLPAGRVEPGETIYQAVVRETLEESGVLVTPVQLLSVEHTPSQDADRASKMRFIFHCDVVGNEATKTIADEHTVAAGWFTLNEITELHLRHAEVIRIIELYIKSRRSG